MGKIEKRDIGFELCGLRVREAGENGEECRVVEGHAVVWNKRSVNLTPWSSQREIYEVMEEGSIDQALIDRSDVVLTAFHDNGFILGRSVNGKGTLELTLDAEGLAIRCELPNTARADEMMEAIKRGDIGGMSFAYTADEEDNENGVSYERTAEVGADGREVWVRHVKRVNGLYDVTIAGHPAYKDTDIAMQREEGEALEKRCTAIEEAAEAASKAERERLEAEEAAKREAEEKARREAVAAQVAALREAAAWR